MCFGGEKGPRAKSQERNGNKTKYLQNLEKQTFGILQTRSRIVFLLMHNDVSFLLIILF